MVSTKAIINQQISKQKREFWSNRFYFLRVLLAGPGRYYTRGKFKAD